MYNAMASITISSIGVMITPSRIFNMTEILCFKFQVSGFDNLYIIYIAAAKIFKKNDMTKQKRNNFRYMPLYPKTLHSSLFTLHYFFLPLRANVPFTPIIPVPAVSNFLADDGLFSPEGLEG